MACCIDQNSTFPNLAQDDNEIRLILLGMSGGGKSRTGNTLLNFTRFLHKTNSGSITKCCQVGYRKFEERDLVIVDTPGFFDNRDLSKEETCQKIGESLQITVPGPHAFLIVLPFCRITPEVNKSWEWITDIFGERALRYCIIVFTYLDNLENEGESDKEYINNAIPELKQLMDKCGGRYVSFNNISGTNEQTNQTIKKLLHYVTVILQANGNRVFQNTEIREIASAMQLYGSEFGTVKAFRDTTVKKDGTVILLPQIEKIVMEAYMRRMVIANIHRP